MSISIVEFGRGDNDVPAPAGVLHSHRLSHSFYLAAVFREDRQNGFGAAVLHVEALSDQKGRLRNPACSRTACVADLKVDEVAADHGHDFVPLAGEQSRLGDFAEASTSGIQILSRNQYTALRVTRTLQLRQCETFDLGQMLYINGYQHPVIGVRSARALSVQEGGPGHSAAFGISTVLHNEIDVVFAGNGHVVGPPFHSIGTRSRPLSSSRSA